MSTPEQETPDLLTPPQLARKLNVSLKTIRNLTQKRRVPGQIKVGRLWRYRLADVEKRLLSGSFFYKNEQHT